MSERTQMHGIGTAVALLLSSFVVGCAIEDRSEEAADYQGRGEDAELQQRVDDVLASIPGGHQVSVNEIDYDGLKVTIDPSYSAQEAAIAPASVSCSDGWFCIVVRGTHFEFFKCQMWDLSNWFGPASFFNNQSPGTVAKAYGPTFDLIWSDIAKHAGDQLPVDPWWHFQPCGGP
jgi:hypothetical protein